VRTLRSAALACAGALLLAGAWFTAMGGAVVWLQPYLSLAGGLAAAALLSAGVGASAIAIGIHHARTQGEFGSAGAPPRTGPDSDPIEPNGACVP
jgi:hypothetical protein